MLVIHYAGEPLLVLLGDLDLNATVFSLPDIYILHDLLMIAYAKKTNFRLL